MRFPNSILEKTIPLILHNAGHFPITLFTAFFATPTIIIQPIPVSCATPNLPSPATNDNRGFPPLLMKKHLIPFVCVLVLGLTSGCVTQLKSDVSPGTHLAALKKIHVVHQPADERGIDGLIAERLNLMGRQATHGEKSGMPADTQAIITYQDKWMWDITMYMIELNVQVRNPGSDIALASGHSMRTSLARKSPPAMVEEVLTDLFKP